MKILAIICLLGGIACAETPWQLTTADLRTQKIDVRKIDSTSVNFVDEQGHSHQLPAAQFVEMRRSIAAQTVSSNWLLLLEDGQRWAGNPLKLKEDRFTWAAPLLGELQVHLADVAHIIHAENSAPPFATGSEDVIHLANGDAVHGAISGITDQQITLQTASASTNIAWSAIAEIDFARLPGSAAEPALSNWQITLDDGTMIHVPSISWSGNGAGMTVAGRQCSVKLSHVTAIQQLRGPVLFLVSQAPAENVQTPLLGAPWPAQFGVDLDGNPAAKAISVRAYSRLTWSLPAGFQKFHTQYAIPDNLALADVTVRIQIDDKIIYQQSHLHGGIVSDAVDLPLNHGHRLTLEVDTDNPYRAQGWLVWISPALLR